ncbi:hypothetical protein BPMI_03040 [Candidatus Burkholderia pumila]|uniref:Uncharacterized protein n=1 Tax=Candidatus Burkholderia pumila TaxID=1090375 RepID=A0ABR5HNZ8_9BURK|nr:hypothetical protein BPMI_03040 [Candidatus Burkholderia pumila]
MREHDARRQQLLDSPALIRLQRIDALKAGGAVQRYITLWDRHGPRSGTSAAVAQGAASKRRGEQGEALAAHAIEELAQRMNEAQGADAYRVMTSMRVPSTISSSHDRAKTEWDVALLKRADIDAWNVRLLVEAKVSPDAATTDFPRLLRGLRLLASADANAGYTVATQQGPVRLRGASLCALSVLHSCYAPADAAPRLLEPVWHQLLESPRWSTVLNQYPTLRQVRELMVHPDDPLAAMK